MDRNSLVGFGLIFLILIGYYWFTRPSEAELAAQQRRRDSIERVESAKAKAQADAVKSDTLKNPETPVSAAASDTAAQRREMGGFATTLQGKEERFVIENDKLAITLSNKGGRIGSVRLKEYRRSDSTALMLFDQEHSSFYYEFFTNAGSLRTDQCFWQVVSQSKEAISFRLSDGQGSSILQHYRLAKGDYLLDYSLQLDSMNMVVLKNRPDLKLVWESTLPKQERDVKRERETSTIYYRMPEENPEYISEMSYEEKELKARLQWVSFKQQFFNSTLIARDNFDKDARLSTREVKGTNEQLVKTMRAELYLPYDLSAQKKFSMHFFFGPNHFQTLNKVDLGMQDLELHRIIPLGWGIFRWVNRYIVIPVFNFLDDYIGNYGIIILLLTFTIRLLLLPLVFKSYKSTAKMRLLKPELDAIKEKYNGDLQKSQVESMGLYRKAGVSPMSGCIPLLLQMPVLIALFQFFPSSFELRQKAFLWAHDLSQFDSIYNFPGAFHIPGYGNHISLFTLLMTLSTLATTYMNNQLTGVTGQMKWLGYIMPVIFMGVLNSYAAGLNYYYFVSNMVGMGQQWLFKTMVDEKKLHAQMEANRKKPASAKSGFQKRMDEMMKQQKELQARKQQGKKK
jgi:YidC/Oxa1 family membrane protein insertase